MTEIKKGDWVYRTGSDSDGIKEAVFKCVGFDIVGNWNPMDDSGWVYIKENCHRLTPLGRGGGVKHGTRFAVIGHSYVFDVGEIVKWDDSPNDIVPFVKNKNYRSAVRRDKLARLPDCAQRAPGAPDPDEEIPSWFVKSEEHKGLMEMYRSWDRNVSPNLGESKSQYLELAPDGVPRIPQMKNPPKWLPMVNTKTGEVEHPTPLPCPHPEWEGVWVRGHHDPVVVKWVVSEWSLNGTAVIKWSGPYNLGWTLLEPAPTASTAGPKLPRPPRHGGVTVPWDPYGEG